MRSNGSCRTKFPQKALQIEYEDDEYIYISSSYTYKELKRDIEDLHFPMTLIWL